MKRFDGWVSLGRLAIHGYNLQLGFMVVALAMGHSALEPSYFLDDALTLTLSTHAPASFLSTVCALLTGVILLSMVAQEVFLSGLYMSTSMPCLPVSPMVKARRRGLWNLTYIAIPTAFGLLVWVPGWMFADVPQVQITSVVWLLACAGTLLASPVCSRLLVEPTDMPGNIRRVLGVALPVSLVALLLTWIGGSLVMLTVMAAAGLGLFVWGGPVHVIQRAPVGLRSKRTGPLPLRSASSPQVAHFTRIGRIALWQSLTITGGVACIAILRDVLGDGGLDLIAPYLVAFTLFHVGGATSRDVTPLPISTSTRARISLGQRLTFGGMLLAVGHLLFGLSYPLVPVLGMVMLILTDAMLVEPAQVAASRKGTTSDKLVRLARVSGFYIIAATLTWTMLPPPLADRPDHWHPFAEALYQQQLMPEAGLLQYALLGIGTVWLALLAILSRRSLRLAA